MAKDELYSKNYKSSLQKFYLDILDIDLSRDQTFMEKELVCGVFTHFIYVHQNVTCNMLRTAEQKIFDNSWSKWPDVDAAIHIQKRRPAMGYWGAHQGGSEPDKAHRNKFYITFSSEKATYMVIKEYMLCRLFAYLQEKEIWDKKGITITDTLATGSEVMCGSCPSGRFHLDWSNLLGCNPNSGPRSLEVF